MNDSTLNEVAGDHLVKLWRNRGGCVQGTQGGMQKRHDALKRADRLAWGAVGWRPFPSSQEQVMAPRNDEPQPEHKDHGMKAFGILLVLAVVVLLAAITVSGMDKFG